MLTVQELTDIMDDLGYESDSYTLVDVALRGEVIQGAISGVDYLALRERLANVPVFFNHATFTMDSTSMDLPIIVDSQYHADIRFSFSFHAVGTRFSFGPKHVLYTSEITGQVLEFPTFALANEVAKREREELQFDRTVNPTTPVSGSTITPENSAQG